MVGLDQTLNQSNNRIYTSTETQSTQVPAYKISRLAFGEDRSFWPIWNTADYEHKTYIQLVYKLATRMKLERFNDPEVLQMLIAWHKKHQYKIDYTGLSAIVQDARKFTLDTLRQRKRDEMRRYRSRKKAEAAALAVSK
jgi:hypothetical protein